MWGFLLEDWFIYGKSIDGLRSYRSRFIHQKRDEPRETGDKDKINEINREQTMDLLIAINSVKIHMISNV